MRSTLIRRTAVAAATAAVLLGGAFAASPTAVGEEAPTVGASRCDVNFKNFSVHTTTAVKLRNGPSTKYRAKGLLSKGTKFRYYCGENVGSHGGGIGDWYYGEVRSGAHNKTNGWVKSKYTR